MADFPYYRDRSEQHMTLMDAVIDAAFACDDYLDDYGTTETSDYIELETAYQRAKSALIAYRVTNHL